MAEVSFGQLVGNMSSLLSLNLSTDWPNLPVKRAEGVYLYGCDGRRYLDFTSGMAANNLGHRHPTVMQAAREQMDRLVHGAVGVVMYESILRLAHELAKVMPGALDTFFFLNGGSEAVDGALKLARHVTRRPGIICFHGAFHGRTYGATSVTSVKAKMRQHYEPLVGGVYSVPFAYCLRCPYGRRAGACGMECLRAVERLLQQVIAPDQVAAVLVEPVQGEGGYIVPPAAFLKGLRALCDEHGILLILDEVQTGFGRTGGMFAAQTFGVDPDVMVIGKGIASGFPLSAVVAPQKLMQQWTPGSHGTTFGGNPVSCAAALATLQAFEQERVLENVRCQGEYAMGRLQEGLEGVAALGELRGCGLMIGLELVDPDSGLPDGDAAQSVAEKCLDQGLVLYNCGPEGQVVRLIPPLVITRRELDQGLDIVVGALKAL